MILILDVKIMTLKSSNQSAFGLSHILYTAVFTSNDINQITALAINIYHSVEFLTGGL